MTRIVILTLLLITTNLFSQNSKLYIPLDIQKAYNNGTRTFDGSVSEKYWINKTDYKIDVELFPDSSLLIGNAIIKYFNLSPDSLSKIVLRLYQNITKPGSIRDWNIPDDFTGNGMEILSLKIEPTTRKVLTAIQ